MKYFAFALLMAIASIAQANISVKSVSEAGFDKLDESQQAAILKQIVDQRVTAQSNQNVNIPTTQKVDEWITVGEKIGKMFGGAAKEVGIAVNEFVNTPVGKWTMALIIWKFLGGVIVHVVGGIVTMIIGGTFITIILRRGSTAACKITYSDERTDLFGRARRLSYERKSMSDDDKIVIGITSLITLFVAMCCIFSY